MTGTKKTKKKKKEKGEEGKLGNIRVALVSAAGLTTT